MKFKILLFAVFIFHVVFAVKKIAVVGYYLLDDGLGKITASIYSALEKNYDVYFINTRSKINYPSFINIGSIDDDYDLAIFTDVLYYLGFSPTEYIPVKSKQKICYSMFESSKIPDEWVDIINNKFDYCLVPDAFLKETYTKTGVVKPVIVLPPSIHDLDNFLQKNDQVSKVKKNKFTFLFSSFFLFRKNHIKLLEAFINEFKNDKNVELILHGRGQDESYNEIMEMKTKNDLSNVRIIKKFLSRVEYIDLLVNSSCYVSLSMGEGFSIPPREAFAAGIPSILLNNTAQKSLCKEPFFLSIEPTVNRDFYFSNLKKTIGTIYDCDVFDVQVALREMYNNYTKYKKLVENNKEWVLNYTPEAFQFRLSKFIQQLSKE
jgi:glycosyltransferase involved in cell wall biosynthesis